MTMEEILAAQHCRKEDLDVAGECFGMKFHPGGSNGLVSLFVEDDELWFLKVTFDIYWLKDLQQVIEQTVGRPEAKLK